MATYPTVKITPASESIDFMQDASNKVSVIGEDLLGDGNAIDLVLENYLDADILKVHRRGLLEIIRDTTISNSDTAVLKVLSDSTTLFSVHNETNKVRYEINGWGAYKELASVDLPIPSGSNTTTSDYGIVYAKSSDKQLYYLDSLGTEHLLSGSVISVSGTANRITIGGTSINPIIDIASNYVGQSSITTLGTITTGIWHGTPIADAYISSASSWNAKVDRVGDTMTGMLFFSTSYGIDVTSSGGSDVLNIGTGNADIINIGWSGATINMIGTLLYENVTNLTVTDKLITLNKGGAAASGASVGFEIEENSVITGYFTTTGSRNGWDFKSPAISYIATISQSLMTADRTYTLPDVAGRFITTGNLTDITAVGTIGTGVWQGTPIADAYISSSATWNAKIGGSLTSGYIPYATGTSTIANSPAYTDGTGIGIGTAGTPLTVFEVVEGSTGSVRGLLTGQYSTGTNSSRLILRKARGTRGSPTVVVSGDNLGTIIAEGYDGGAYIQMGQLLFGTEGTIASTRVPTFFTISTATNAAPSVLTEAVRIDSRQFLGIGTAPSYHLDFSDTQTGSSLISTNWVTTHTVNASSPVLTGHKFSSTFTFPASPTYNNGTIKLFDLSTTLNFASTTGHTVYGIYYDTSVSSNVATTAYGAYIRGTGGTAGGSGITYGIYGHGKSSAAGTAGTIYGVYGNAEDTGNANRTRIGVAGSAGGYATSGTTAYGVYGEIRGEAGLEGSALVGNLNYAVSSLSLVNYSLILKSNTVTKLKVDYNGTLTMPIAPQATGNYGLISIGDKPFDGVTSNFFTGYSAGTYIAINKSSTTTNFIDFQVSGVSMLKTGDTSGNTAAFQFQIPGLSWYSINILSSGQVKIGTSSLTSSSELFSLRNDNSFDIIQVWKNNLGTILGTVSKYGIHTITASTTQLGTEGTGTFLYPGTSLVINGDMWAASATQVGRGILINGNLNINSPNDTLEAISVVPTIVNNGHRTGINAYLYKGIVNATALTTSGASGTLYGMYLDIQGATTNYAIYVNNGNSVFTTASGTGITVNSSLALNSNDCGISITPTMTGGTGTQAGINILTSGSSTSSSNRIYAASFGNASSLGGGNLNMGSTAPTTPQVGAGVWAYSYGNTSLGYNVGVYGASANGVENFGAVFRSGAASANATTNVGVFAFARNANNSNIGGYFALNITAEPTWTTAAIIADNGNAAAPIQIWRDNGTEIARVPDGGGLYLGYTTDQVSGAALLQVNGSGYFSGGNLLLSSGSAATTIGWQTNKGITFIPHVSLGNFLFNGGGLTIDISGASSIPSSGSINAPPAAINIVNYSFSQSGGAAQYSLINGNATYASSAGTGDLILYKNTLTVNQTGGTGSYSLFDATITETALLGTDARFFKITVGSNVLWKVRNSGATLIGIGTQVGTEMLRVNGTTYHDDKVGIKITPTAYLHLAAGTASANTAPLKFTQTSAALLTATEAGAFEADAIGALFYTNAASVRQQIVTSINDRATAQTGAKTLTAVTVGSADASYVVSANVAVTTSTNHSFTVTCTYTDETNTVQTVTLTFSQTTGIFLTSITNVTGAGVYLGIPLHIRAKASTTITIASTGTFTTVTYNIESSIKPHG